MVVTSRCEQCASSYSVRVMRTFSSLSSPMWTRVPAGRPTCLEAFLMNLSTGTHPACEGANDIRALAIIVRQLGCKRQVGGVWLVSRVGGLAPRAAGGGLPRPVVVRPPKAAWGDPPYGGRAMAWLSEGQVDGSYAEDGDKQADQ